MKRSLKVLATAALLATALVGCGASEEVSTPEEESNVIVVGGTASPHHAILEQAVPLMEEKGYELVIDESLNDYNVLNTALQEGAIFANLYQHKPFMDGFNAENGGSLVSIGETHCFILGLYSDKINSIEEIQEGASVVIPNDVSNGGRALLLLEAAGLITLKEDVGLFPDAELDIVENPLNLQISLLDSAGIPRALEDSDLVVITGNYALEAGYNTLEDSLYYESEENTPLSYNTYGIVIAVDESNQDNEAADALVEVLTGPVVQQYIADTYNGSVLAYHLD